MTSEKPHASAQRLLDTWSDERQKTLEKLQAQASQEDVAREKAEHEARLGLRPPPARVRRVG